MLGTIQTFLGLDIFCSEWMPARSGLQGGGRREDVTHKQSGGL